MNLSKRLLLTRSRHDIGNQYLYAYSEEILEETERHGWKADKAEDQSNNAKEIASRLTKTKPLLLIFNGHGSDDAVYGYDNAVLVDADSTYLLNTTIVFARTCSAVNGLGKEAVNKAGCRAFIGYNNEFVIPHVHEFESTPLRDPTAQPVLEVSNGVAKILLKGSQVRAAVNAAKSKALELIWRMLTSEEPYDSASFRALVNNDLSLAFEGEPDASC